MCCERVMLVTKDLSPQRISEVGKAYQHNIFFAAHHSEITLAHHGIKRGCKAAEADQVSA